MRFLRAPTKPASGFTLIELLVTVALIGVLAALAAPSMREFTIRNKISSLGNEFSASVLRSRNEAVGKNTCVTMCISTTVDNASPTCATSGEDWQAGWITFLNPSCSNTNAPSADDLIFVRRGGTSDYSLTSATSGRRKMIFNARGNPGLSGATTLTASYQGYGDNAITAKYGFVICVDAAGRTRTISSSASCS